MNKLYAGLLSSCILLSSCASEKYVTKTYENVQCKLYEKADTENFGEYSSQKKKFENILIAPLSKASRKESRKARRTIQLEDTVNFIKMPYINEYIHENVMPNGYVSLDLVGYWKEKHTKKGKVKNRQLLEIRVQDVQLSDHPLDTIFYKKSSLKYHLSKSKYFYENKKIKSLSVVAAR